MITAHSTPAHMLTALREGAVEYLSKPFDVEELKLMVAKQLLRHIDKPLATGSDQLVGQSRAMWPVIERIPQVARSDATVLITGDSGTGKELVARAIHAASPRAARLFVPVNCGALPEGLLESELFGHVRGSFTGAVRDKRGLFQEAHGGTLFLDEVGELSSNMQVKLLRALQERKIRPVGDTREVSVDVRVLVATNQDLLAMVREGRFREDLYYRLNVVKLELPPLAERREDVPLLVEHFLKRFNVRMNKRIASVSQEVMQLFMRYDFPGNIRELENAMEHAFVLCSGTRIQEEHLPQELLSRARAAPLQLSAGRDVLMAAERQTLLTILQKHGGNRKKASAELGISPVTLWRKLKKTGG
jgi:DNA-binding NtrC family response regulator